MKILEKFDKGVVTQSNKKNDFNSLQTTLRKFPDLERKSELGKLLDKKIQLNSQRYLEQEKKKDSKKQEELKKSDQDQKKD